MQSTFTYMNKINLQNNGETEAQGGSSDLLSFTKLGGQGQNLNYGFWLQASNFFKSVSTWKNHLLEVEGWIKLSKLMKTS